MKAAMQTTSHPRFQMSLFSQLVLGPAVGLLYTVADRRDVLIYRGSETSCPFSLHPKSSLIASISPPLPCSNFFLSRKRKPFLNMSKYWVPVSIVAVLVYVKNIFPLNFVRSNHCKLKMFKLSNFCSF